MPVSLLREWMAFDRYIEPFGREWHQTGTLAAIMIAPHVRGKTPKAEDFIPIMRPPMTGAEIAAELSKIKPPTNGQT
jgi:hypothetical protein